MSYRSIRLTIALLVSALAALAALAGAAHASVSALEKGVTQSVYNEVNTARESPSNHVIDTRTGAVKPYNIDNAWCASFVAWAMRQNGVEPTNSGYRPGLKSSNLYVARDWAHYGSAAPNYGRDASTQNPMPGDLLVERYYGSPGTGGHISMVIGPHPDGLPYVWTVGGNEGDAVRLQRKNLTTDGHWLVTFAEFRTRKAPMYREDNTRLTYVGDAFFDRYYQSGARLKMTGITLTSGAKYSASYGWSNYQTRSNLGTYAPGQVFGTDSHAWIQAIQGSNVAATLTSAGVAVDRNKATSSSSIS